MSFLYGSRELCVYSKTLGLKRIHNLIELSLYMGGTGSKPYSIRNYNIFILTVEHCNGILMLKTRVK